MESGIDFIISSIEPHRLIENIVSHRLCGFLLCPMCLCGKKNFCAKYSELSSMQQVINGIDSFLLEPGVNKNSRFAMVTNNAAFTSDKLLSRLGLIKE